MKKLLIIALIVAAVFQLHDYSSQVSLGPGVKAAQVPRQSPLESAAYFEFGDYRLSP